MSMLSTFERQMEINLTPEQAAHMQEVIEIIESENGPMTSDCKPRHLGNFRFSFARVPAAVLRTIVFGFGPTEAAEFIRMLR